MQYKIADLITAIPAAGDLVPRCREYICQETEKTDIVIEETLFRPDIWPTLSETSMVYMESGIQFYKSLLHYNGIMLHSSAVELDGKAYLFSGPCRTGKSTHTKLWQQVFGEKAQVFNDDKPAIRFMEDGWYAYGTPWSGKHGINQNKKVPLAGICFLKQSSVNKIRRLFPEEAVRYVIHQTLYTFKSMEKVNLMLDIVTKLVQEVPIYELENRPEEAAAWLSYKTMSRANEENGA